MKPSHRKDSQHALREMISLLQGLRRAKRLSYGALSKLSGIDVATCWRHLTRRTRNPTCANLDAIARVLGYRLAFVAVSP